MDNNKPLSAIVVGASLAGLMTGLSLAHSGVSVTILEKTSATPRSGASLRVDPARPDSSESAEFLRSIVTKRRGTVEAWSTVQARLRKQIDKESNIQIHFDTKVIEVGQDNHSAWAITEQGGKYTADLLVGADGYRSLVRKEVNPEHPVADFAGYLLWVDVLPEIEIDPKYWPKAGAPLFESEQRNGFILLSLIIASEEGSYEVGKRRLGFAMYDNTQNRLLRKQGNVKDNVVQYTLRGKDIPEEVLEQLSSRAGALWQQPSQAVIQRSIEKKTIVGTPISEYIPEKLVKGRMVILGDAAHVMTPMTGSGFNSSLDDASVLAESLRVRKSIEEALTSYEIERLPISRYMVQYGHAFSEQFAGEYAY